MAYTGQTPLAGLTVAQISSIENSTRKGPKEWHDGLWRLVAAALPASGPPWLDHDIASAIQSALETMGLDDDDPSTSVVGPNEVTQVAGNGVLSAAMLYRAAASSAFGGAGSLLAVLTGGH
jgi:hypothetical protein